MYTDNPMNVNKYNFSHLCEAFAVKLFKKYQNCLYNEFNSTKVLIFKINDLRLVKFYFFFCISICWCQIKKRKEICMRSSFVLLAHTYVLEIRPWRTKTKPKDLHKL